MPPSHVRKPRDVSKVLLVEFLGQVLLVEFLGLALLPAIRWLATSFVTALLFRQRRILSMRLHLYVAVIADKHRKLVTRMTSIYTHGASSETNKSIVLICSMELRHALISLSFCVNPGKSDSLVLCDLSGRCGRCTLCTVRPWALRLVR